LKTNFVALFSCYLSIQTICIVKSAVKTILIVVLNRFELNWRLSKKHSHSEATCLTPDDLCTYYSKSGMKDTETDTTEAVS